MLQCQDTNGKWNYLNVVSEDFNPTKILDAFPLGW